MPRKSSNPPPVPYKHAPVTATATVPRPSFGQTLKEGLAFGVGQGIAHRVVGHVFGGAASNAAASNAAASNATASNAAGSNATASKPSSDNPEYTQCMQESFQDAEACKRFL